MPRLLLRTAAAYRRISDEEQLSDRSAPEGRNWLAAGRMAASKRMAGRTGTVCLSFVMGTQATAGDEAPAEPPLMNATGASADAEEPSVQRAPAFTSRCATREASTHWLASAIRDQRYALPCGRYMLYGARAAFSCHTILQFRMYASIPTYEQVKESERKQTCQGWQEVDEPRKGKIRQIGLPTIRSRFR